MAHAQPTEQPRVEKEVQGGEGQVGKQRLCGRGKELQGKDGRVQRQQGGAGSSCSYGPDPG